VFVDTLVGMRNLADLRSELADFAARFDSGALTASDAEQVVRDATAIVNLASTVTTLAARRVVDSGAWRHRGHRTAAGWLASTTKSTVGDAIGVLETGDNLAACPGVEARIRAGELTGQQAHAISRAVVVDPSAESTLLATAETDGISKLRQDCRSVEHAASGEDAEARHARIHRNRSLRHWTDDDGTFRLDGRLTVEVGAKLLGALSPFQKMAFDQARADDRHEAADAYQADALEAMADASLSGAAIVDAGVIGEKVRRSAGRKPSFTVLIDLPALLRGHTQAGETCEIPGVGPIPVSLLREYGGEAVWHALVTDGVDIRAYCSLTRHIPTMLRIALEARDRECVVPGCNATRGLEIDHTLAVEDGGPTTYTNLARPCHHHHRMKHQQGWLLAGGPGGWSFTPPDHPPKGPSPP
jgi:hypothetical protein